MALPLNNLRQGVLEDQHILGTVFVRRHIPQDIPIYCWQGLYVPRHRVQMLMERKAAWNHVQPPQAIPEKDLQPKKASKACSLLFQVQGSLGRLIHYIELLVNFSRQMGRICLRRS